jgi:gliding motility-associated-like protein
MPKQILFAVLLLTIILPFKGNAGACASCKTLVFKENKNQWAPNVLYKTELGNSDIFLEKNSFTFLLANADELGIIRHAHTKAEEEHELPEVLHCHAYRVKFDNANPNPAITGSDVINEYFNYYLGNDPKRWAAKVKGYTQVNYTNIYNNINLRLSSEGGNFKYDIIVKPLGDYNNINLTYEGTDGISLQNGNLVVKTSVGEVIELAPYAYQLINGERKTVACKFNVSKNTVYFSFPNGFNKQEELVIDPTLIFSTYSGSTADNFGYTATYDSRGNAYAAGSVFDIAGGGYPTTLGAFQTSWAGGTGAGTLSGTDIGITKYDSAGTSRIYSTYLGGNSDELPHSIVVNSSDELFILGTTSSNNFPVTIGSWDTSYNGGVNAGAFNGIGVHYINGSDIIVARLNQNGTALLASTYLGGTDNDGLNYPANLNLNYNYADEVRGEIDIDADDNIYIASCTRSSNFPITAGAVQNVKHGILDGVLVKMDNNLSSILWSTYLGGEDLDAIYSLALDNNNDIFVSGGTNSDSFPVTAGALQTTWGGGRADGFITHIDKTGQNIINSTYYGYTTYDQIYFVETNRKDEVYVFGQTDAVGNPYILNSVYNQVNSGQFISQINFTLDTILRSTTFGNSNGKPNISPTAFLVDVCNKIYVAGWGSPALGPAALTTAGLDITPDAYQPNTDGSDFYLMVLEDDMSALSYATYFGSPTASEHVDGGTSRFDRNGICYQSACAGCASSQDNFPTYPNPGAVSNINPSPNCNNAIFKFDLDLPIVVANFVRPPTGCAPYTVSFQNTSTSVLQPSYQWFFGDNTSSTQFQPSHSFSLPGTYTVTLVVTDPGSCNSSDTISKLVTIIADTVPAVTLSPITSCLDVPLQIGIAALPDTNTTYTWTPAGTLNDPTIPNPFANPADTTFYTLIANNGVCSDTFYRQVNVLFDSLFLTSGNVLCPGDTLQLSVQNSAVNQVLSYSWQPATQILSGANTSTPSVLPVTDMYFTVTGTNTTFNCVYVDSILVNVVSSLPDVNAFADPDTITYGDTSQLSISLSPSVTSFLWDADTTLSAVDINNPLAYPLQTNTYYVEVADSSGCTKRAPVTVYVVRTPCKGTNIFIPSGFSPNGDGKNDVFYVRGNNITKLYLAVYDRWGQKVFDSSDINKGWDGNFNGKKLDPAVFGYYVEGECPGGEQFTLKGNVSLFR